MASIAAKQVSPHIIRHSTAMHLLQAGVDINTIRGWLAWRNVSTVAKQRLDKNYTYNSEPGGLDNQTVAEREKELANRCY